MSDEPPARRFAMLSGILLAVWFVLAFPSCQRHWSLIVAGGYLASYETCLWAPCVSLSKTDTSASQAARKSA